MKKKSQTRNMENRLEKRQESGEQQTDNVYHARDKINGRKKSKTVGEWIKDYVANDKTKREKGR